MVSIQEAKDLISKSVKALSPEIIPVNEALNRVLSSDVVSPLNLPSFRQSAMDGFAMRREDLDSGQRDFPIQCEIQAGKSDGISLQPKCAIQIFTGAAIPEEADIVVIQEKTTLNGDILKVNEFSGNEKSNIRQIGEQIKSGDVAIQAGHNINAATIGFLASMGIEKVEVFIKPKVGIVLTGNELKKSGTILERGEIYESNSVTLEAALTNEGFQVSSSKTIGDTLEETIDQIKNVLNESDMVIVSGGISVGKYDFVKRALEENGVKEVFYKVNQKPGKPLYFGMKENIPVFALPGNPASLLVCYYVYVVQALRILNGEEGQLNNQKAELLHDYHHKGPRPEFLRSFVNEEGVIILQAQASSILKSFAEANCLTYIHGENQSLKKGSEVNICRIH